MDDPHINFLLKTSRRHDKLRVIIDFAFDETLRKGEIYIDDTNSAVALWHFEKKEKMSVNYIYCHVKLIYKIGIRTIIRILRISSLTKKLFTNNKTYCYLYFIGVLSHEQGKGLSTKLLQPMIDRMRKTNTPVFLETANPINVSIYKKKGFEVFDIIQKDDLTIYSMQIKNNEVLF